MSEQDFKINVPNDEGSGQPEESQSTDSASEESQVKKLTTDLADLQQTLLRRQADFENYRKRIEKERGEDSKRGEKERAHRRGRGCNRLRLAGPEVKRLTFRAPERYAD